MKPTLGLSIGNLGYIQGAIVLLSALCVGFLSSDGTSLVRNTHVEAKKVLWTVIAILCTVCARKLIDIVWKFIFYVKESSESASNIVANLQKISWQSIALVTLFVPFIAIYSVEKISVGALSSIYLIQFLISIWVSSFGIFHSFKTVTICDVTETTVSSLAIILMCMLGNRSSNENIGMSVAYVIFAVFSMFLAVRNYFSHRLALTMTLENLPTTLAAAVSKCAMSPKISQAFHGTSSTSHLVKDATIKSKLVSITTHATLIIFVNLYYLCYSPLTRTTMSNLAYSWNNHASGAQCLNYLALGHTIIICLSIMFKDKNVHQNESNWKIAVALNRQFARFISHELRSPLNHMHLATQFILDDISKWNENAKEEQDNSDSALANKVPELRELQRSCETMLEILNEVLLLDELYENSLELNTNAEIASNVNTDLSCNEAQGKHDSHIAAISANTFLSDVFKVFQNGVGKSYVQNGVNVNVMVDTLPFDYATGDSLIVDGQAANSASKSNNNSNNNNNKNTITHGFGAGSPNSSAMLFVDSSAIKCVIKTLLSTAIQNTPTGSNVHAKAYLIPDSIVRASNRVRSEMFKHNHSSLPDTVTSPNSSFFTSSSFFGSQMSMEPLVFDTSTTLAVKNKRATSEHDRRSTDMYDWFSKSRRSGGQHPNSGMSSSILSTSSTSSANSSKCISPRGMVEGGLLKIVITDEGNGLSADDRSKMLKKAISLAPDDLQCGQAAGLKFAISRAMVERFGGYLDVESEGIGKGCVWILQLPYYVKDNKFGVTKTSVAALKYSNVSSLGHVGEAGAPGIGYRMLSQAIPQTPVIEESDDIESNRCESSAYNKEFSSTTCGPRIDGNKQGLNPSYASQRPSYPTIMTGSVSSRVSPLAIGSMFPEECNRSRGGSSSEGSFEHVSCSFLVVDDVSSCRKVLGKMLRSLGHRVMEARHGQEAINEVQLANHRNEEFQAIFMDCFMPCLDGPSAARQLRALGFEGVIIGFTGIGTKDLERFYDAGVSLVLEKPLRAAVVNDVVRDILTGKLKHPKCLMSKSDNNCSIASEHTNIASVVKKEVDSMNYSNSPAKTNSFRMPASTDTGNNSQSVSSKKNGAGLHFLVVDDVASNRKILCKLLQRMGHSYDEAVDGLQAVAKLVANNANNSSKPFDGVFLDYVMPNMDGPTTALVMRQEYGYKGVIVGVTGNVLSEDLMHFTSSGADCVIGKPVKMNVFESLILDLFKERLKQ